MKHKGCTCYMGEERDEDLMRVFNRICRTEGGFGCIGDVYARAAESPSKRFWVTDRRAYEVCHMLSTGRSWKKNPYPLRKEMYEEIYRRAQEMMKRSRMSLREAVSRVVEQPAPKFYLSAGCAKNIITRCSHTRRTRY